ncbi:type I restriction enzyme HsdR N-terminal domain-containing protein [Blattabacterium cuenoti]|uniref:type I restriction enzyme HsdR N-terminal domain-containing protein n=1 Tax=Blattabacterium cuenoti TaxID=1653831 RepID=UPI00163C5EAF|nr:type I restriction enzyme HsdR N-terminal domain-containing protein [Blattabacterium cuenoti]
MYNNTFNFFIRKNLILKRINRKIFIFCIKRKKFFSFKKEEVVRQHILFILKNIKNYKDSDILVESSIRINNSLNLRLDILVFFKKKPHILIECKSPNIVITQKTFDQISAYNKFVKSNYLMISNGIKNFIFKKNKQKKKFYFIRYIP